MIEDYNGATVLDATDERIGTVERSYVDDSGAVQVVSVKLGKLFAKHRLVPVDGLRPTDDTLHLPYTKALVEAAPTVDADDDLSGEALAQVRRHYTTLRGVPTVLKPEDDSITGSPVEGTMAADDHTRRPNDTSIRDDGEVVEIPIIEEELVKRPVVKEVLRVRKETVTRQQPVETTLRREELVVDEQGDIEVTKEDAAATNSRPEPPPTAEGRHLLAGSVGDDASVTDTTTAPPSARRH